MIASIVFIGGSIGSQIVFFPDIPYLPPVYGFLTSALIIITMNVIYVFYNKAKGKKNKNNI
ncbi:hypothetical protein DV702_13065 [Sporosarcina sp. PTS2304]|nr:hypothetical protein DV702_13065 [Sporosarcina sp. PTS2304]